MRSPASQDVRQEAALAAQWILDFAAPAYGPQGSLKLVQASDGSHALLGGGASSLREARPVHPAIAPYLRVVESVQRYAGDQATGAVLLAAQLVAKGVAGLERGVPAAAVLEGYHLALRQARSVLLAHARPGTAEEALGSVSVDARHWGPAVAAGLVDQVRGNSAVLDLDRVEIRVETVAAEWDDPHNRRPVTWAQGVVVEPQLGPRRGRYPDARVLVLDEGRLFHARCEGMTRRFSSATDGAASAAAEEAQIRRVVRRLDAAGVRLVACRRSFEDVVADALEAAGLLVWKDAPAQATRRICEATGATAAPDLRTWTAEDLGQADLVARAPRDGWMLAGPGAASTLLVPADGPTMAALAHEEAERILRAAGCYLEDPRVLPGGGRWQREVQAALRKAAPHAPGKAPLTMQDCSEIFGWLADQLVANAGLDPLDLPLLDDA